MLMWPVFYDFCQLNKNAKLTGTNKRKFTKYTSTSEAEVKSENLETRVCQNLEVPVCIRTAKWKDFTEFCRLAYSSTLYLIVTITLAPANRSRVSIRGRTWINVLHVYSHVRSPCNISLLFLIICARMKVPKILGEPCGPALLGQARTCLLETRYCSTRYHTKFRRSTSNRLGVIMKIRQKLWSLAASRLSRSLKVIGTDTDRSGAYDFLLSVLW